MGSLASMLKLIMTDKLTETKRFVNEADWTPNMFTRRSPDPRVKRVMSVARWHALGRPLVLG